LAVAKRSAFFFHDVIELCDAAVGQPATVRKIALRLLPFLFLLYIVAFLDRVNVSFAGLDMTRDLNFSDRVFGLGAGIFFIGYMLFEIPGALLVERWSARKVIARILVTLGNRDRAGCTGAHAGAVPRSALSVGRGRSRVLSGRAGLFDALVSL
jgi:MFS family permease